jgi:phosphatidylinositol glycan class F
MNVIRTINHTAAAVPIFYFIAVIFGAPFLSHFSENFVFALTLSLATALPLTATTKDNFALQELIYEARALSKSQLIAHHIAFGSVAGAWLGAFVIPLDWDRWWQKWPLPCIFGILIGSVLAIVVAQFRLLFGGIRAKLDKHSKIV